MAHHHHHHGEHDHGHSHSHSHDAGHIETAARAYWQRIAPAPRALGGLDELAVRLCMAQGAHHPSAAPRQGLYFSADETQIALSVVCDQLSNNLSAPFESVPLRAIESVDLKTRIPRARDMMRAGSIAAANAMRDGAKLLLIAINQYPVEQAAALFNLLSDTPLNDAAACFASGKFNLENGEIMRSTLEAHQGNPVAALAQIGNAELLAAAGAVLQAGSHGTAILFDGLHAVLAGAAAAKIDASVKHSMFAAATGAQSNALWNLNISPVFASPDSMEIGVGALLALQRIDLASELMNKTGSSGK
ncbi:MAG: nicotinate-nucleotide--dimethylbenzimidazole phosphoribosyltransferase [Candidatus Hinthialibacter antarcticus]|nr:nicotinate-nucleotide--dimethylbenzimidazole phosphoribosyltransferase [Candidatus Hinthialibacter antarcticus]